MASRLVSILALAVLGAMAFLGAACFLVLAGACMIGLVRTIFFG